MQYTILLKNNILRLNTAATIPSYHWAKTVYSHHVFIGNRTVQYLSILNATENTFKRGKGWVRERGECSVLPSACNDDDKRRIALPHSALEGKTAMGTIKPKWSTLKCGRAREKKGGGKRKSDEKQLSKYGILIYQIIICTLFATDTLFTQKD